MITNFKRLTQSVYYRKRIDYYVGKNVERNFMQKNRDICMIFDNIVRVKEHFFESVP